MLWICDACSIKPINSLAYWIDHYNTKKHKKNMHDATHVCLNCYSCFIYDKKSSDSKKRFEKHMDECKKNILDQLIKNKNENIYNSGLIEKNEYLESGIKSENDSVERVKEENIKLKEENIKLKEENKSLNDLEKENIKLKGELKYVDKLEIELKESKSKNELLNEKIHQLLVDHKVEVTQFLSNSNNDIRESKNEIIKICDKQINLTQTVSKTSGDVTKTAMGLLGFLQKQCPDAEPLLEFTNENYEYPFTVDKVFVFDILYSHDNGKAGEF